MYCPVAIATEILGERWTILVVMALADGATRFNDIQRALPKISASTLSHRLRSLEQAGVAQRIASDFGDKTEYRLTPAGIELGVIVYSLGVWGHRWGRDLDTNDLDPHHLMWNMHLRMNVEIMPRGRTTIEFCFADVPADKRLFWIVVNDGKVDGCLKHPGYKVDLEVSSRLHCFTDAWRGFSSIHEEVRAGRIKVRGPKHLCRAFPDWLLLSMLAGETRCRPGREHGLQRRTRTAP
jgi:DNA-binding HxlR family transcriptional regulator